MNKFVFPPLERSSIAVHGSDSRFPVRRIFCVGRNYAAHAREMGKDPDREPPFIFMKPADCVVDSGSTVPYPPETKDFQFEIELVVAIGREGFKITPEKAPELIFGSAVGIDLTRRDLQLAARDKGRPWDWGKAFDSSAPIASIFQLREERETCRQGRIWLSVNGETKQEADISELIWTVPEIISIISQSMVLKPGDLIMTGTPAGVGPVSVGDKLAGGIERLGTIEISIGPAL
jgi:fumarylpyruvate hydrolase